MKIFDLLGREIKVLVNNVMQAGNYTIDFNGSDVASGIYFYKLQSGNYVDIKKMLLIK